MIKALFMAEDGEPTKLFLGLSFQNVSRMREGQPVFVRGAELGLDIDVVIHVGRNEDAIIEDMRAAGFDVPPPEFFVKKDRG